MTTNFPTPTQIALQLPKRIAHRFEAMNERPGKSRHEYYGGLSDVRSDIEYQVDAMVRQPIRDVVSEINATGSDVFTVDSVVAFRRSVVFSSCASFR